MGSAELLHFCEQVRDKLGLSCDDLGEQAVKNIPRPVRVFRVRDEAPTAPKVTRTAPADRPSIVVLPFANMSSDPEQEYFCDGMAEEVINALTQVEGLHVVARFAECQRRSGSFARHRLTIQSSLCEARACRLVGGSGSYVRIEPIRSARLSPPKGRAPVTIS